MLRRPPRSTRTDTLLPYTTLCLSRGGCFGEIAGAQLRARLLQQFAQRILAPLPRTGVLRLQSQDALVQRQCGLVVAGPFPRLARGVGLRSPYGDAGVGSFTPAQPPRHAVLVRTQDRQCARQARQSVM